MEINKEKEQNEPKTIDIDAGSVIFFVNKAFLNVNALNIARYVTLDGTSTIEFKEYKNAEDNTSVIYIGDNITKCEPLLYKSSPDDDEAPDAFRCSALFDDDTELTFILHIVNGVAVAFDVESVENKEAFDKFLDENPDKHIRVVCTHGTHVTKPDDETEGDVVLSLNCFINIEAFIVDNDK